MQTQKITLDFCQNDYKTVTVKQYDKDSRNLIITCTDNGAFYKLNSSTLQCNVKMNTPDDRAIYDTATIKEDGTVLVTFSESMVYASGTGKLEIQFLDSSTQRSISTMILTVIIVGSVYPDDKIIASDEFSALTDALLKIESDVNAADEAIERINELEESVTTAEAGRVVAEEFRVLAESNRASAENVRVANENTRKTNETTRQTAESKRQLDTATAIANAEEATDRANEMAENCKDLMLGSGISITTTETTLEGSKDGLIRIESIGGESQQFTTAGNQLFNKDTCSLETGLGTSTGNAYGNADQFTTDFIDVSNIEQLAFNGKSVSSGTFCVFYDSNKAFISSLSSNSGTITVPSGAHYVRMPIANEFLDKLMINAGTTVLPYEPYTGGIASPNPSYPQEIKKTVVSEIRTHGKNLLKNVATTKTVNGVTFTMNSDGSVTLNGTATSNGDCYLTTGKWGNTDNILGAIGSFILTGTGTKDLHVYAGYGNGALCSLSGGNIEAPFNAQNGVSFVFLRILSGVTYSNFTYYPMIRKADVEDATYEPYTESVTTLSQPIELYGRREFKDVIVQKDGVWGVERNMAVANQNSFPVPTKNTDDGFWIVSGSFANGSNALSKTMVNAYKYLMCDSLLVVPQTSETTSGDAVVSYYGHTGYAEVRPRLRVDKYSAEEVKAICDSATFCYPCKPTFEALPIADQIALNSLKSFDTITYISTDSEIKPIITTEYGTSKTSAHAVEALNKADNAEIEISEMKPIVEELKIPNITSTTETTMPNSYDGRLKVEEIVGGESQQNTTSGKNLLNVTFGYSITKNGVTCTIDNNGIVTLDGTATADGIFLTHEILTTTANKRYNLEVLYVGGSVGKGSSNNAPSVANQDGSNGWQGYNVELNNSSAINSYKFGIDLNMKDAHGIYVYAGNVFNNYKFRMMFLQTDSTILDDVYEPYTGGIPAPNPSYPQEIKKTVVSEIRTRKNNMFDVSKFKTNQYISGDGSVVANGAWGASDYMMVKSPSVTISHKDAQWFQLVIAEYDSKKNFIRNTSKQGFLPTVTQELSKNTSYIRISYSVDVGSGVITREEVMINEGTTALPYEPYTESVVTLSQPIELYGIGDVQDVIEGGKVKRKFEYLRATGNNVEFITPYAETGNAISINKVGKIDGKCISNRFIGVSFNDRVKDVNSFRCYVDSYSGNIIFRVPKSENDNFTSKGDTVNFFDNNEVCVLYELATPTTEELPLADQIALNSLSTYDGITYLEFDSEIEPTFKGEYGTSKIGGYTLEGMLAGRNGELYGKNYVDRLAALEAAIVNNI